MSCRIHPLLLFFLILFLYYCRRWYATAHAYYNILVCIWNVYSIMRKDIGISLKSILIVPVATYYYYADYDDDCYRLIINSIERTRWDGFFRLNDHTTAAYVIIETRLHIGTYTASTTTPSRLHLIIVHKRHRFRDFGNMNR